MDHTDDHLIEIGSFNHKFNQFIEEQGHKVYRGPHILRYFECLEIRFFSELIGEVRKVRADILPRIDMSKLAFQVNVNIENFNPFLASEEIEQSLLQCISKFFARECRDSATRQFVKTLDPNAVRVLFFCQGETLLLRISKTS